MTAALSPALANRWWLIELLGPESVAALTRPLTAEQERRVDEALAQIEKEWPTRAAIMTASEDELPGVLQRLAEEGQQ